jgi:hypothetical protein
MMATDDEGVEEALAHLRGRGPRPGDSELLALLEAITDAATVEHPPFEDDPAAIRLGLVPGVDAVTASLRELAHRLGGQLDVEDLGTDDAPGPWRPRAVCRTLGETVLVVSVGGDDFALLLDAVAGVLARRPTTTAVALASDATHLGVVLTAADCVAAIDPRAGWAAPALPREPEPFGLALGRHLERSLPRWDEIARLDEMLVLGGDDEIAATVGSAVEARRSRPARIPAKRAALAGLADLDPGAVVAVVEDVRAGRLAGDELLGRIRRLAGVGPS